MKQQKDGKTSHRQTATNKKKARGKVIVLESAENQAQLNETGKLAIAQCRAILCKEGAVYSDEEVYLVRKVLYALAEVDYKYHCNQQEQRQTTTIPLNTSIEDDQQESHSLHPRIYRRTG